jgi:hypothetical protein
MNNNQLQLINYEAIYFNYLTKINVYYFLIKILFNNGEIIYYL